MGQASDINVYRYGLDNPAMVIDPSGLFAVIDCTRCGMTGPIDCTVKEDGQITDEFTSNLGDNDPSITPGDPYGTNGPVPPGRYYVGLGRSNRFGRSTPGISNNGGEPGEFWTPNGTHRTVVWFHRGNWSQGCFTLSGSCASDHVNFIKDLVDRHESSGGTWLNLMETDCEPTCETEETEEEE